MTRMSIAAQDNPVRQLTSVSGKGLAGVLSPIILDVMAAPRYAKKQRVCFSGGIGIIKSCQLDSKTWTYAVEMELGPEPKMGRIGSETTILMQEVDIQAC